MHKRISMGTGTGTGMGMGHGHAAHANVYARIFGVWYAHARMKYLVGALQ